MQMAKLTRFDALPSTLTAEEADEILLSIGRISRTRPSAKKSPKADAEEVATAVHLWTREATAATIRKPPADGVVGTSKYEAITIEHFAALVPSGTVPDLTKAETRINTVHNWLRRMLQASDYQLHREEGQSATDYLTNTLLRHVKAFSMFRDPHRRKRPAEDATPKPSTPKARRSDPMETDRPASTSTRRQQQPAPAPEPPRSQSVFTRVARPFTANSPEPAPESSRGYHIMLTGADSAAYAANKQTSDEGVRQSIKEPYETPGLLLAVGSPVPTKDTIHRAGPLLAAACWLADSLRLDEEQDRQPSALRMARAFTEASLTTHLDKFWAHDDRVVTGLLGPNTSENKATVLSGIKQLLNQTGGIVRLIRAGWPLFRSCFSQAYTEGVVMVRVLLYMYLMYRHYCLLPPASQPPLDHTLVANYAAFINEQTLPVLVTKATYIIMRHSPHRNTNRAHAVLQTLISTHWPAWVVHGQALPFYDLFNRGNDLFIPRKELPWPTSSTSGQDSYWQGP